MKAINNNGLKATLLNYAAQTQNLISYRELYNTTSLNNADLMSCKFELVLLTNATVEHTLIFDYNLTLLDYKVTHNEGKYTGLQVLNSQSMARVAQIFDFVKALRNDLGYTKPL